MNDIYKILEITKDNEQQYLQDVVNLEEEVLKKMEKEGRIGQLFITGKEGIKEYIESDSNYVMIAVKNDDEKVISASYITQGQIPFTYNDITKYFKCDEGYQEFVKSKYSESDFKKIIRIAYIEKICAYKYARDLILKEHGIGELKDLNEEKKNKIFLELVEAERNDPNNQFHEKSEIRENLNKYMSLYMKHVKKNLDIYEDFYWVDFDYLKRNFSVVQENSNETEEESRFKSFDSTIDAYDKVLQYQKYKIHDNSHCNDISKYYSANTSNTIELDTYITHPRSRENGIARILTFEGIKKSVETVLKNKKNKEVFLVSTLHEDNLSSKYVSEFFGLNDYLFVNRRNGRDRQVHIHVIPREKVPEYISDIEKKIAVLYGYNPQNIQISEDERRTILKNQINYEVNELQRLNAIKDLDKKYTGYISGKKSKIEKLHKLVDMQEKCKKINNDKCEVDKLEVRN